VLHIAIPGTSKSTYKTVSALREEKEWRS